MSKRAHLIYAQGPVASGFPANIVGILLRKKVVVKVVGDYAWEQAQVRGKTELDIESFQKANVMGMISILRAIERLSVRRATKIIVPSNYVKLMVAAWGVVPENIVVVYNAAPQDVRKRVKNKQYDSIISIGRLVPWKGFENLIRMMPTLLKRNHKFRLLILGDGPLKPDLENLIQELGLKKFIRILKVNSEERERLLAEAVIFVLNTNYEGLSHTLLEAMASGVPIITTNVGGNRELIVHNKNGILITYNDNTALIDSIFLLWGNSQLQTQYSEASLRIVKNFSTERMINETTNILENI